MNPAGRRTSHRITVAILAGLLLAAGAARLTGAAPRPGASGPGGPTLPLYDVRVVGGDDLAFLLKEHAGLGPVELVERIQSGQARMAASQRLLQSQLPGIEATRSPLTGSAEILRVPRGALTRAAHGDAPEPIVRGFLRDNAGLYGLQQHQVEALHSHGVSRSRSSGLVMVLLEQRHHGKPVFQAELRAIVDREGRLVRTTGRLVPDIGDSRVPPARALSAEDSLTLALSGLGIETEVRAVPGSRSNADGNDEIEFAADDASVIGPVRTWPLYFPLAPGVVAPAWAHVIFTSGAADWYVIVDAKTGLLLWRKNIRSHATTEPARFSVYSQSGGRPADSPAPASPNSLAPGASTQFPSIARTIESMLSVQDLVASPFGWIPDGQISTTGNNVDAFLDRDGNAVGDAGTLDFNGRPIGNPDADGRDRDFLGSTPRNFGYTPSPQGSNPGQGDDPSTPAYQRGVVTHLFYLTNWFHDKLYALGFDEAARNFQLGNFGQGGVGNDRVLARAQDSADLGAANNASFGTPPDGSSGQMRMFLWTSPNPDRDGALDSELILHELSHGLTNRIIGNATGLGWGAGAGMGEGWSDFYAMSLLNASSADLPGGQYALAGYSTYRVVTGYTSNYLYGIRRFPYSTDNSVNPLTWADADDTTDSMAGGIPPSPLGFELNGAPEVHNSGEIWALSLWEVRSRIIAAHGGDVALGNQITLQIVTDALKMTPIDPSFIQARDAILDADCAANACENEASIWGGFADRGLGFGAYASLGIGVRVGVKESFQVPALHPTVTAVNDAGLGDADGALEPGESATLIVTLGNPWGHASRSLASATATLVSLTPGVTVVDDSSSYAAIPAGGSAMGEPFFIRADSSVACGASLRFTLTTSSALGTTSVPLTLRTGALASTGVQQIFTATPALAIPDNSAVGVTSSLAVGADLTISDLNLRIDSLTHPFVGDLAIMLKGPGGFGAEMIYHPAYCDFFGCTLGGNDGDNFTNTIIDDESPNDLVLVGPFAAPFSNTWKPNWNSSAWFHFDPVGQLSHLDGTSTQGTWTLFVADQGPADLGTLNSWSIVVTPRAYSCNCSACCTSAGQQDDDADGYRVCAGDCDDTNPAVFPGASQTCDGVNNNCSSFAWPGIAGTNEADDDGDGLSECQSDCDDFRGAVYPGAPQTCDGLNNDCAAPSWPSVPGNEVDGDGDGALQCGDCDDAAGAVFPGAPEICDGLNNDCNAPGWPALGALEMDTDGDGLAPCAGDCSDAEASVHPGAAQICGDGLNNDCSHSSWPALTGTNESDGDGDGLSACSGDCNDFDPGSTVPAGEIADLTATHNRLTGVTTFSWGLPATGGGAGLRSDFIRSDSPSDFLSTLVAVCLESNDSADRVATDPSEPLFNISYYLQRWENGCPVVGIAGRNSNGVVKPVLDCP